MSKSYKLLILSMCAIFIICDAAFPGGLSTQFVEVRLKDVIPGKTYSVKDKTGRVLVINNTAELNVLDIGIKPEKPSQSTLLPGYEPIPDVSWIKIEKDFFEGVEPGKSAETDILVSIPSGKKYYGKKYQVYIYSHTAGKETFRMGLMSRLLIETKQLPKGAHKFQRGKKGSGLEM